MNDLITWLRAQLDEAERHGEAYLREVLETRLEHDARFRLAEVEAKRKLLDAWPQDEHDPTVRFGDWTTCGDDCVQGVFLEVVKLLAQPYAGRPGWREEWAA